MNNDLARRSAAEAIGTAWLVAAVVGSGIMAERLTEDAGIRLLANAAATVGPLFCLIVMMAPISGAHFNPVVTIAAILSRTIRPSVGAAYVVAQVAGGCLGTAVANTMFDLDLFAASTTTRSGGGVWLGEVVATAGLLMVIRLVGRSRPDGVPAAVAVWIGGAYWFTSSTSLANPAVTVARSLTDTFTGISPGSVPAFIGMQLLGMVAGLAIVGILTGPSPSSAASD